MEIKNINIENFTVFNNFKIQFSKGINLIIGMNGTGKTHILKLMYGLSKNDKKQIDTGNKFSALANLYFKSSSQELSRIEDKDTEISLEFFDDYKIIYNSHKNYKNKESIGIKNEKVVFIPAKEMLSHSKGFLALNNKYELPFDQTYIDIVTNAELPEVKNISKISGKIISKIEDIIDGKLIYENNTFYIEKRNTKKLDIQLEAEGLRKFGLLYKLIKNGLIEKDSILFWDEPESNINPELMPILVDILLMLEEEGVQIFIATHNYNLAKYFELKRKNNNQVKFFSLYKENNEVLVDSNEYFGELKENKILEADEELLDYVVETRLED